MPLELTTASFFQPLPSKPYNFNHLLQVTHMPPELVLEQRLTTASDVFSFGVLLWEMANSQHAWEGMSHTQVPVGSFAFDLCCDSAADVSPAVGAAGVASE